MTFSGLWPRWSNVFRKGLPAAWPWQMAKAKASAVSSGWGTFCNPSSRRVISWTWGFTRFAVARHRLLHLHGGVLIQGHAVLGQGEEITPRASATPMPVVLLLGEIQLFHGGGLGL